MRPERQAAPAAGATLLPLSAAAARRADYQLGLLWGTVSLVLLALAPAARLLAAALPACPFKLLSGLPCAACGTTRAALALARWDPAGALAVNPLAALGWATLVLGGLTAGVLALAGWPMSARHATLRPLGRAAAVSLILANWLYLILSGA